MKRPVRTLLIPALLDSHWPLLRWAFERRDRRVVVLEEGGAQVESLGLRHMNNDLCYPFALICGQVLSALRSGRYAPEETDVLIAQAGDGCRGSCLIRLMRPVLDREGFASVRLLSLNVRGQDDVLPVTLPMARRAVAAAFWGDALMMLGDHVRPYEAEAGAADRLIGQWTETLSRDLRSGRGLGAAGILRRCREIAASFRAVPTVPRAVQKVAVVGELYTKYCGLGNWDLRRYLESQGCEVGIGGVTWYALYYMDTHLDESPFFIRLGGKLLRAWAVRSQKRFLAVLEAAGFSALPPYEDVAAQAIPSGCALGCGWFLSAEAAAWVRAGWRKVIGAMPFGCLPGHIYARGTYARLQRSLPQGLIVGVDYDASTSRGTVRDRIRMLLDMDLPPA